MADMYSIVKKQDEKIDDLLKIAQQNNDLLTDIDTRLASDPEQTTTPATSEPQKIQVELPENVRSSQRSWQTPSPKPSSTDSTRTSQRLSMSASEMSSQARLTVSTNLQRS